MVDADVDEGTERGDVGHDAGEFHAGLEILGPVHLGGEGEDFEFLARITAGFRELGHDVGERRETDFGRNVGFEFDFRAEFSVADQLGDGGAEVGGHFFDERVTLRMNGARVEWVRGIADPQEAGRLLVGLGAEARDVLEVGAGFEGALFVAARDNRGGGRGVETGDVAEELFRGGVELDADAVNGADDGIVEGTFECGLVDVVLVLADADRFWVELYELGERIHETAADGDGAAHREIVVGEFFAGDIASGVNRGAGFVDHDDGNRAGEAERADEGFGLAPRGAVADGDGLDVEELHEAGELFLRLDLHAVGKNDVVVEEFPLTIEDDDFAAGADAGVDGHHGFLAEWGGEEEFAEIVGEDFDAGFVGALLGFETHLGFHRGAEETFAGILHGEDDLGGAGVER